MALYEITDTKEFDEKVINSKKVVLVDFWATWCPPCRAIAPILSDLAEELDDIADVVKINIEASSDTGELAEKYRVQGVPNINLFKDGEVVEQIIGMRSANDLRERIKHFASK